MKTLMILAVIILFGSGVCTGLIVEASRVEAHPRDNCECLELRAIRRILEQQFRVVCDERRCLPVPTPTASTGGPLE